MRVMIGGIKIGVVADLNRQLHHDVRLLIEDARTKFFVIAECWCFGRENLLQSLANVFPSRSAKREKIVQRIASEQFSILKGFEMPGRLQDRKIDNVFTECDTDAYSAAPWFENAERKVFQRKIGILFDFDE